MHWLQALYETYDANIGDVGRYVSRPGKSGENMITPLVPVFHIVQNAHITVVLNARGEFCEARIVSAAQPTIIPATEESETSRTSSKVAPHALSDRLMYLAGNRPEFFNDESSARRAFFGEEKNGRVSPGYFETLKAWATESGAPKLRAVLAYLERGSLIDDLVRKKIISLDGNGKVSAKAENEELAKALGQTEQYKALIRWEIEIPTETNPSAWEDAALFASWEKFREAHSRSRGFCYVSAKTDAVIQKLHPARIRNSKDGAKLISSNDSKGFTYRGRFSVPEEVCCVSAEVSQKAHGALRWLISRQGAVVNNTLAIVAWCAGRRAVPSPIDDESEYDADDERQQETERSQTANASLGNEVARRFRGYSSKLSEEQIKTLFVAAVDSASTGRLSLVCFKEFRRSRYFENLEYWYAECRWTFPATRKGENPNPQRTPRPQQIAECAYGNAVNVNNKLMQSTVLRILPCIIEKKPFPQDLVDSCVARARNPNGFTEKGKWEEALAVACAVFRISFNRKNPLEKLDMNLNESRKTRDYLYGRLLALGEHLEATALTQFKMQGKALRQTKAEQLMQRFATRPFSTWKVIELSLQPYRAMLKKSEKTAGLLNRIENDLDEAMQLFDGLAGPDDFTSDAPLSGEFLLGYHCQRRRNFEKKNDTRNENDNSEKE